MSYFTVKKGINHNHIVTDLNSVSSSTDKTNLFFLLLLNSIVDGLMNLGDLNSTVDGLMISSDLPCLLSDFRGSIIVSATWTVLINSWLIVGKL
jgi:hypothetical protein